jgi:opacity protein-like surface antigen
VAQSTKYPSGQGGGQDVFNAQRHLTLAYRLGVGINYQLTKQLNLLSSIDYQDNGKVEAGEYQDLGRANDDISGPKQDLKAIGFNLALKYTF